MTLQEWCDEFAAWANSEENAFGVDDPDRVLGILRMIEVVRAADDMPFIVGDGSTAVMDALAALEEHAAGGDS